LQSKEQGMVIFLGVTYGLFIAIFDAAGRFNVSKNIYYVDQTNLVLLKKDLKQQNCSGK